MKHTDIEAKKVFAGIMGKEVHPRTGYLVDIGLKDSILGSENTLIGFIEHFNPIDHFYSILEGLTPEQKKQLVVWSEFKVFTRNGFALDDAVYIHNHKPEILEAILEVVGSEVKG